ncbi:TatD family hydrolase [Treponema sp.]|uniref:TatD family hydrolase n=1 Tax=Treponema sp. TaxID=166 RepID=UPI0025E1803E|nr:TatD family hydrolase [Treponema sp.]MCR5217688.1 TatD family hydrolase [Treponema sp.]
MIIDFHTHLDFYSDKQVHKDLQNFSGAIMAASVDEKSYLKNRQIAKWTGENAKKSLVIPTFGIHPNAADENAPLLDDHTIVKRFQSYMERPTIIGEIGMDFCWSECKAENQEKVFRFFLEYCHKNHKACVIHTKDAEEQIADILTDYPNARPIIHWYDGPEEIFREFIRRGYPQTFGVESIRSSHIQNLLKLTPHHLLLAETDNPDSEIWLGGTRNDIALIQKVYQDLAGLLKIPLSEVEKQIEKNARTFLGKTL